MKTKTIIAFICAAAIAGSVSFGGYSADNSDTSVVKVHALLKYEDFGYLLKSNGENDGIEIMEYYGDAAEVVIPEEIDGLKVISIFNSTFLNCSSVTDITIPESVTSIGDRAFEGTAWLDNKRAENPLVTVNGILIDGVKCEGNVVIPKDVTSICESAFVKCSGLTGITIPESVKSIGSNAFSGCENLTTVTLPEGIQEIASGMFWYCESLTDITLPESITFIGSQAFSGCTSLESIIIPENVTMISANAFRYCEGLKSITLPKNLESVSGGLFEKCTSLESIIIPEGITSIPNGMFKECESLERVTIPEGVTSIGYKAFYSCYNLKNITLPESVTIIGESAFSICKGLESITLPEGITSIGKNAFRYCWNLTSVTIPENVTGIDDAAFADCCKDLCIYGYTGSEAESYANNHNIKFVSLGEASAAPVPSVTTTVTATVTEAPVTTIVTEAPVTTTFIRTPEQKMEYEFYGVYPDDFTAEEIKEIESTGELEVLKGDTDGNGVINIADVISLKSEIIYSEKKTVRQKMNSDLNSDTAINSSDIINLIKMFINYIPGEK